MEQQTVRSYTRNKQAYVEVPEQSNVIGYIIGGATILVLALVYAGPTIIVGVSLGAAYGVRTIIRSSPRMVVAEAVTAPQNVPEVKAKRSYSHRLKVHDYATGKTVRV